MPHNFYWYEDPEDGTLTLVPWDLDNAFEALTPGSMVGPFVQVADPFGAITDDCRPFGGPASVSNSVRPCVIR